MNSFMASKAYCQIAFQRSRTNLQCHHEVICFPDGQLGLGMQPLTAGEEEVCVFVKLAGSYVHGFKPQ